MEKAHVKYVAIDPFSKMPYEYTCFSEEKFAHLIISECLDKVEDVIIARELTGRYYPISDSRKIKDHFGVKE